MDRAAIKEKLMFLFKEYRYVIIILAVGLLFLSLPSKEEKPTVEQDTNLDDNAVTKDVQQELEELLSKVKGAGKVCVLLTEYRGEEIIYQTNEQGTETTFRSDTVIITGGEKNERGLVKQTIPPSYRGAVILCQGADIASVRLAITDAVSNATGLTTDKISVLKMK